MERSREDAVSSVVSLIVAGAVFMGAVGTVLVMSQQTGQEDTVAAPIQRAEAELLMRMLLDSEGQGSFLDPDNITRAGLKSASGGIALSKMDSMRGAQMVSVSNNILDYDEARAGLALDQPDDRGYTTHFHMRIYPVAQASGIDTLDLSGLRVAYVGDWVTLVTVTVGLDTDAVMIRDADAELNSTLDNGTLAERTLLASLGVDFRNQVFLTTGYPDVLVEIAPFVTVQLGTLADATLMEGDVFPDDADYLQNTLENNLGDYDVLVIGSGVDHGALGDASLKQEIADWVEAGGALMVFGSEAADPTWLDALLSATTASANGGAYTPDATHPVLKTPNALAWGTWPDPASSWVIPSTGANPYAEFAHVLTDSGGTLLGVSDEGAFGEGRIFLLGHAVRDIEDMSTAEATAYVENLMVYIDQEEMYLDFGATVPTDANVASAVRHTFLEDDDFGHVPVRVELLVWRA